MSPDDGGSRNRKMRSSSSDAAAALQRSDEEAATDEGRGGGGGGGPGFIRRTSDPLCLHRLMPGTAAAAAAAETEKQTDVESASNVQIPVVQRHKLLGRTTSHTDPPPPPAAPTTVSRAPHHFYSTRQHPATGFYYSGQATHGTTPSPLSVYVAPGGELHSTPLEQGANAPSGIYASSSSSSSLFYSGSSDQTCQDPFKTRDSRWSFRRRHRHHDDQTTTATAAKTMTNDDAPRDHPPRHHRPQSLLVSRNSREAMTSVAPPPGDVAMATEGTKNTSRLRRATSLRIHRRSQKAKKPAPVDSVYI